MDANEFKQKLIDELKSTWAKQDEEKDEKIVHLSPKQAQKKFDEVVELIEKTDEKYNLEDNLYKRKELDEKIATIFKKYPEILTIQDKYGANLGMIAVYYSLEQSVLVALDNKEASLQQNEYDYNIGMFAAMFSLEQATLKAMQNKEACEQRNINGDTIKSLYREYFGKVLAY